LSASKAQDVSSMDELAASDLECAQPSFLDELGNGLSGNAPQARGFGL
jgi:hypothetical protein